MNIREVRDGSGTHGLVLDGSGTLGGHAERSWTGRGTLGEVRDGSGDSRGNRLEVLNGLEDPRAVQAGSMDPLGRPGRVGRPSKRSGTGRETLDEVRN